jgi:hydrogenase nickel incorporation protein HypA/HybF
MHELGITRNIAAIVLEAAKGKRVTRIGVDIGVLAGIMADAVAFCFDVVAKGTPLEGAKLEIRRIEGAALCRQCDTEFPIENLHTPCSCGSRNVAVLRGEELMIKTMETEEAA